MADDSTSGSERWTVRDLLERYDEKLEELDGEDPAIAMIRACDEIIAEMEEADNRYRNTGREQEGDD